jgi:hypothetical protein
MTTQADKIAEMRRRLDAAAATDRAASLAGAVAHSAGVAIQVRTALALRMLIEGHTELAAQLAISYADLRTIAGAEADGMNDAAEVFAELNHADPDVARIVSVATGVQASLTSMLALLDHMVTR